MALCFVKFISKDVLFNLPPALQDNNIPILRMGNWSSEMLHSLLKANFHSLDTLFNIPCNHVAKSGFKTEYAWL